MIHAPREGRRRQEKAKGFRAHLQVCLNYFEYFEVRILLKWTNTSCAYPSSIFRSNLKYLQMCWLGSSPKAVGQPSSEEEEEVTRKRSEKDGERWAEAIYCNFQWCWVYYHIQLIYYTPDILHHLTISYNYVGCSASLVWAGLRFCGDFCQIFCCVFFLPQSLSLLLHDSYAAAMHAMKPLLFRTAYDSSDIDEEDLSEWVPTERRGPKHKKVQANAKKQRNVIRSRKDDLQMSVSTVKMSPSMHAVDAAKGVIWNSFHFIPR